MMHRCKKKVNWKHESHLLKTHSTIYIILLVVHQFHHIFCRERDPLISFQFCDNSRLKLKNSYNRREASTLKQSLFSFAKRIECRDGESKFRTLPLYTKSEKYESLLDEAMNSKDNNEDAKNVTNEISFSDYIIEKSKEVEQQLLDAQQTLNQNFLDTEENKSIENEKSSEYLNYNESISSMEKMSLSDFENDTNSDVMIDELQIKQLESSITPILNIENAMEDIKVLASESAVIVPSVVADRDKNNDDIVNKVFSENAPLSTLSSQSSSFADNDKLSKRLRLKRMISKIMNRNPSSNQKRSEKSWLDRKAQEDMQTSDDLYLHRDRIRRDIRHLAVRIASTIESTEQWTQFCKENGGFEPLFESIQESAFSVNFNSYDLADYTRTTANNNEHYFEPYNKKNKGTIEKEEIYSASCAACKALRDLCALSPDVAAIVTDHFIKFDKRMELKNERTLFSDLIILLRYNSDYEKMYQRISALVPLDKGGSLSMLRRRAISRIRRRRCQMYILQLLLAMTIANDEAVSRIRSTAGLKDAILACSSYSHFKEEKNSLWRSPFSYLVSLALPKISSEANKDNGQKTKKMTKPKMDALSRMLNEGRDDADKNAMNELESPANKILAAIGYNIWVPKSENQRGLRILSIDGGGTRGITALASLKAILKALDGLEPNDAFDMIAGTSTGGIIAFLIGLRRESVETAQKRYDTLIKRIFVKSALATPMLVFTTASYDEAHFTDVMKEILGESSMLDSRADSKVPLVFAVSSKMSSTPTQLCLFRNYNYNGGEMPDKFVVNPDVARKNLKLPLEPNNDIDLLKPESINGTFANSNGLKKDEAIASVPTGEGSRHPGSFRISQRIALRASTAAPTFFKPLLMGGELYCDGGVGASNPTAVAIHEARTLFPDTPIELVVSLGTGAFEEEISEPKIGWDGILGQIVNSALDAETTHHTLEDILGQGGTANLGRSSVSQTKYYRFNPVIGKPDAFGIDETSPEKLRELAEITAEYMRESEQTRKLSEIKEILKPTKSTKRWWNAVVEKIQK